jgi:hypothetical protein
LKSFVTGFSYQGIIRIAVFAIMLSAILYLYGDEGGFVKECPLDFSYEVTALDSTYVNGSRFLFTYTISMDSTRVTSFDMQRTYTITSDFLIGEMNGGGVRTVSFDIKDGETFTYSQFPITGHLTVKYGDGYGYIISPFIDVSVAGTAVEGCPDSYLPEGDKLIQQCSSFVMCMPNPPDNDDEK